MRTTLFALLAFASLTACGGDYGRPLKLTLLCSPHITAPNAVSFVFKAEDGRTLQPVTDLQKPGGSIVVDDGGATTGAESSTLLVQRSQQVAIRSLVLLDASGSLWDAEGKQEQQIRDAVLRYVDGLNAADDRSVVGIYFFTGSIRLGAVYPFDAQREDRLNPQKYADPAALMQARADDRAALEQALRANYRIQRDASTALHDAIGAALQEIGGLMPPDRPVVIARSLVLFTDGHDETYAGTDYTRTRTAVLTQADDFRKRGDVILVAGVEGSGDTLDTDLLGRLASPGGFVRGGLDGLGQTLSGLALRAANSVQRYYQFNMCSNRRAGTIMARLRVSYSSFADAFLPFSYDAGGFRDPGPAQSCDVARMETCAWSP